MATTYAGSPGTNLTTSITIPQNGDAGTAESVNTPLQTLADDAATLDSWFNTSSGVGNKRVIKAVSLAALKALSATQGDIVALSGQNPTRPHADSLYSYCATSTDTEAIPWVITPDSGTGRWHHVLESYTSTGSATRPGPTGVGSAVYFATTDSNGFLVTATKYGLCDEPFFGQSYSDRPLSSLYSVTDTEVFSTNITTYDWWEVDAIVLHQGFSVSAGTILSSSITLEGGSDPLGPWSLLTTSVASSSNVGNHASSTVYNLCPVKYFGQPLISTGYSNLRVGVKTDIPDPTSGAMSKLLSLTVKHYRG